ncbi:T-cell surface glycoprotein CD3 delta chain isoform X2 [Capricornis sumatraensis]|uniref:T-cell surface glycoprotein CD3 delta chain isoform X2 n=1 Tax=Capricornis sumatraensis TaxID=34865 RepID=UPI0036050A64
MEHSRCLSCLILAALLSQVNPRALEVMEPEDKVILKCNSSITLLQGTAGQEVSDNKTLDLGKRIEDPRGMYQCGENAKSFTLQVYYRTADTQVLMGNDQLYQPLRERNDAQYSRLGDKWARNK